MKHVNVSGQINTKDAELWMNYSRKVSDTQKSQHLKPMFSDKKDTSFTDCLYTYYRDTPLCGHDAANVFI